MYPLLLKRDYYNILIRLLIRACYSEYSALNLINHFLKIDWRVLYFIFIFIYIILYVYIYIFFSTQKVNVWLTDITEITRI